MTIKEAEKFYICSFAADCLEEDCLHNQPHKKDTTCNWNDGPYVSVTHPVFCVGRYPLNALCCIPSPPIEHKTMTIVEAEERCKELNKQISAIQKDSSGFGSWAWRCGLVETKSQRQELSKLYSAIRKIKETTKIEI